MITQIQFFEKDKKYYIILAEEKGKVFLLDTTDLYREILTIKNLAHKKWVKDPVLN